jgi:hypothetical protein
MEAAQPTCTRCGYSLSGLPKDGNCPECAHPVAESLKGDFLRFADPVFARRIDRGAALLSMTLGLGVLLLYSLMGAGGGAGICLLPAAFLVFAVPILGTIGWCLFTTADPSRVQGGPERALVNTSRAALAGAGLLVIAGVVLRRPYVALSGAALLPVFYTAALLHLRFLARRCQQPSASDVATGVLRIGVLGIAASVVLIPLHWVGPTGPVGTTLFILRCALYLCVGFCVIMSPILIAVCLSAIREELAPLVRPEALAAAPPHPPVGA